MPESSIRLVASVIALSFLVAFPVTAQTTTGQIVGVVRVQGGDPLQGAEVRATSAALQGARSAITGADGRYFLPVLPPGVYVLDVSGSGHSAIRMEGVEVFLGGTTVADATLAGAMLEKVTVTGEIPLVDARSADNVVVLPRKFVDGMPLATRSYRELAKLVPSVTATDTDMTTGRGQGSPNFRGEGQYGDNFLVDGLTSRNPFDYTPGTPIPLGSIQEVQLVADGFSPEYGQVVGGLMNVVTRSGSNTVDGEFSYIYTSSGLASEAEPTLLEQPTGFHDATPRFDIGGPILEDRLWYFASVDGVNLATDYAPAELPGVGTIPAGTVDASGFTGFAKLTTAITPNHNLALNYTRQKTSTDGLGSSTATPEARQHSDHVSDRLRINYQAIFGSMTILELKAGYSRENDSTRPVQDSGPASWEVVSYGVSLHNSAGYGERELERIDLAGTITQVWHPGGPAGLHEFKAGIEHHLPSSAGTGVITGAAEDVISVGQNPIAADYGLPDTFNGGSKVQVAAVDDPSGTTILFPVGYAEYRSAGRIATKQREWGLFLQDRWDLGRWALMFGVRFDSQESMNDVGDVFSQFEFGDTVAPRFSATFDLTGKGRDILKGAWGRFYDVNSLAYGGLANVSGFYSFRTYQWVGAPADSDFRNHVDDGSAYDIHNPDNWAFSFEQSSTLTPFDYTRIDRPPGADRWLLEYDHVFPHDIALAVRYVNHKTIGLVEDVNRLDPNTFFRFVAQNTDLDRRDYQSGELVLTARPRPNLSLTVSYVHSRSYGTGLGQDEPPGFVGGVGSGNYFGVYLDRPASDPAFWCTFFEPSCLPPDWNTADPRLDLNNDDRVDQLDYDLSIQNLFAGLGSTQTDDGWYGPLAYAVDDLVKSYGRWDLSRGFYLGWYLQWSSGYHMSRRSFVPAYGEFFGFTDTPHYEFTGACTSFADCTAQLVTAPEEDGARRGSIGMPSNWNLDLTAGKLWQLNRDVGLELRADVLNVFNRQAVLTIQDRATDTFGEPLSRQTPRAFRLYATLRF
jgi:hypothetical protein